MLAHTLRKCIGRRRRGCRRGLGGAVGAFSIGVAGVLVACSGDPGPSGNADANALVSASAEPAGANCPYGGTKIEVGLDMVDVMEHQLAGTRGVAMLQRLQNADMLEMAAARDARSTVERDDQR